MDSLAPAAAPAQGALAALPPAWILALLGWLIAGALVAALLARADAPAAARAAALFAWPLFLSLLAPPAARADGPFHARIAADLSRLQAAMQAAGLDDPAGLSALRRALTALDRRRASLALLLAEEQRLSPADHTPDHTPYRTPDHTADHTPDHAPPEHAAPIAHEIARCDREIEGALRDLSALRVRLHLAASGAPGDPAEPLRPALHGLIQRLNSATEPDRT